MDMGLIEMKKSLTPHELEILKTELERKKKAVVLAYLLWFFLSYLGLHKFYLGRISQGLLYMLGPWIAIGTLFGGAIAAGRPSARVGGTLATLVGVIALLSFIVWWFVDLFTLHKQVEDTNESIEWSLLMEIKRLV
jgi:TM2 domain-containing membrane protein YozV